MVLVLELENMKTTRIRKRASKESLELLVRSCEQFQKEYLKEIFDFCESSGEYSIYNSITGENIKNAASSRMTEVHMPQALQGSHKIVIDLPDYTGLTATDREAIENTISPLPDEQKEAARKVFLIPDERVAANAYNSARALLSDIVVEQIIKPTLMQDREEFRKYFTSVLIPYTKNPGEINHLGFEEIIGMRPEIKEALKPEIETYVDALIAGIQNSVPDFEHGTRVEISYTIDKKGKLRFDNSEMLYIDDRSQHIFSINIPEIASVIADEDETEKIIEEAEIEGAVRTAVENKYIGMNLMMTGHPELTKLFYTDDSGQPLQMTSYGRGVFKDQTDTMIDNLLEQILEMPDIMKGGLVAVKTQIDDIELESAIAQYVMLDPEQEMLLAERLPSIPDRFRYSSSDTPEEHDKKCLAQGDIYEESARTLAIAVMAKNMRDHVHFTKYFEPLQSEPEDKNAILEESVSANSEEFKKKPVKVKEYRLTDKGEEDLERIYDKITDRITEAMIELGEQDSVPFYMKLRIDGELDVEGVQEPVVHDMMKTFLAYGYTGFPEIKIDSRANPDKRLTKESLRSDAAHIVDKVISRVIRPHMKAINHPDYDNCFIKNPNNPAMIHITEEGVTMLEDVINHFSSNVSREVMQIRSITPEHMDGLRVSINYIAGFDNRLIDIESQVEYFGRPDMLNPQNPGTITFPLPDKSKWLETLIPEKREEEFKKYLFATARNLITRVVAENVRGSQIVKGGKVYLLRPTHPAYESFFMAGSEEKPIMMTDIANNAIGETVKNYSQQVFKQLTSIPHIQTGGTFLLTYDFGRAEIKYAEVEKLGCTIGSEARKTLRNMISK